MASGRYILFLYAYVHPYSLTRDIFLRRTILKIIWYMQIWSPLFQASLGLSSQNGAGVKRVPKYNLDLKNSFCSLSGQALCALHS